MADAPTAETDPRVADVHADATQDHLAAAADESVVADAEKRDSDLREHVFGYREAAAGAPVEESTGEKPADTRTFGSPETQEPKA